MKYKNRVTEYNGKKFHSAREATDAMWLDSLLKAGKIKEVKTQHKIDIRINGNHWRNHYVDFLVTLNDGRKKYVECKGFPTEPWKMKMDVIKIVDEIPYLVNPQEKELLG